MRETGMNVIIKTLGIAAALGLAASPALAQDKLKIGLMPTLSGPPRGARPAAARRLSARRQGCSAASSAGGRSR